MELSPCPIQASIAVSEIPLRSDAKPVGRKRLPRWSVRDDVYRESSFGLQPKRPVNAKQVNPPFQVNFLHAIAKVNSTANKFIAAPKLARQTGDHRRSHGLRKRANNLLEILKSACVVPSSPSR